MSPRGVCCVRGLFRGYSDAGADSELSEPLEESSSLLAVMPMMALTSVASAMMRERRSWVLISLNFGMRDSSLFRHTARIAACKETQV